MLNPRRIFFLFFGYLFIGYLLAKELQPHGYQHHLLICINCLISKYLEDSGCYTIVKNFPFILIPICADYLKRHESKKTNFVSYFIERKDCFKISEAFLSSCEKEVTSHLLKRESILLGTIVKDKVPLPFITTKKEFSRQFPKELYHSLEPPTDSERKNVFKIGDNYFIPCFNFRNLLDFFDNCFYKCCLSLDITKNLIRKIFFKDIKLNNKSVRNEICSLNCKSLENILNIELFDENSFERLYKLFLHKTTTNTIHKKLIKKFFKNDYGNNKDENIKESYVRDYSFMSNRLNHTNKQTVNFLKRLYSFCCVDIKFICKYSTKLCLKDNVGPKDFSIFSLRKKRQIQEQKSKRSSVRKNNLKNTYLFKQQLYNRFHIFPDKYLLLSSKSGGKSVRNSTNKTIIIENMSAKSNKHEKRFNISEFLLGKSRHPQLVTKMTPFSNFEKHFDEIISKGHQEMAAQNINKTSVNENNVSDVVFTTEEILMKENSFLSINNETPFSKITDRSAHLESPNSSEISNAFKKSNTSLNSKLKLKEASKATNSSADSRKITYEPNTNPFPPFKLHKTILTKDSPILKNESFDFMNNFTSLTSNKFTSSKIFKETPDNPVASQSIGEEMFTAKIQFNPTETDLFEHKSSVTEDKDIFTYKENISTYQVRTPKTSPMKNKATQSIEKDPLSLNKYIFSTKMSSFRGIEDMSSVTKDENSSTNKQIISTQQVQSTNTSTPRSKSVQSTEADFLSTSKNKLFYKIPDSIKTDEESSVMRSEKYATTVKIIATQQVQANKTNTMENESTLYTEHLFLTNKSEFSSKLPHSPRTELIDDEPSINIYEEISTSGKIIIPQKLRTETNPFKNKITRSTGQGFLFTNENEFSVKTTSPVETELLKDESLITMGEEISTQRVTTTVTRTIKNENTQGAEEEILLTDKNGFSSKISGSIVTNSFDVSSTTRDENNSTTEGIISTRQVRKTERGTVKNINMRSTEEYLFLTSENELLSKISHTTGTELPKDKSSLPSDEKYSNGEPVNTLYITDRVPKTLFDTNTLTQEAHSTGEIHTLLQNEKQTGLSNLDDSFFSDISSSETESTSIPSDETNKFIKVKNNSYPSENLLTTKNTQSDKDLDSVSDKVLIRTYRDVFPSTNRVSILENVENPDHLKVKISSENDSFPPNISTTSLKNRKYISKGNTMSKVRNVDFTPSNENIDLFDYEKSQQSTLNDKKFIASSIDNKLLSTVFSLKERLMTNNEITNPENELSRTERQVRSSNGKSNLPLTDVFLTKNSIIDKNYEATISMSKINSTEQTVLTVRINRDNTLPSVVVTSKSNNTTYKSVNISEQPVVFTTGNTKMNSSVNPTAEISLSSTDKKFTKSRIITPKEDILSMLDVITQKSSTTNKELRSTELPVSVIEEGKKLLSVNYSTQGYSNTHKSLETNNKFGPTQTPTLSLLSTKNQKLSSTDELVHKHNITYQSIATNDLLRTTQRPLLVRHKGKKTILDSDSPQEDSTLYTKSDNAINTVLKTTQKPVFVNNEDNKLYSMKSVNEVSSTYESFTINKKTDGARIPIFVNTENNNSSPFNYSIQEDGTTYKSAKTTDLVNESNDETYLSSEGNITSSVDTASVEHRRRKEYVTSKTIKEMNSPEMQIPSSTEATTSPLSLTSFSQATVNGKEDSAMNENLQTEKQVISPIKVNQDILTNATTKRENEIKKDENIDEVDAEFIRTEGQTYSSNQEILTSEEETMMDENFQTKQIFSSSEDNQDISTNTVTGKENTINKDENSDEIGNELIRTESQVFSSSHEIMPSEKETTKKENLQTKRQELPSSEDNQEISRNIITEKVSTVNEDETDNELIRTERQVLSSSQGIKSSQKVATVNENFQAERPLLSSIDDNQEIFRNSITEKVSSINEDETDSELIPTERQVLSSSQEIMPSEKETTMNKNFQTERQVLPSNEDNKEISRSIIKEKVTTVNERETDNELIRTEKQVLSSSQGNIPSEKETTVNGNFQTERQVLSTREDNQEIFNDIITERVGTVNEYGTDNEFIRTEKHALSSSQGIMLADKEIINGKFQTERQVLSSSEDNQEHSTNVITEKMNTISEDQRSDKTGNELTHTEKEVFSSSQGIMPSEKNTTVNENFQTERQILSSSEDNQEIFSDILTERVGTVNEDETDNEFIRTERQALSSSQGIMPLETTPETTMTGNFETERQVLSSSEDNQEISTNIIPEKDNAISEDEISDKIDNEHIRTERDVLSSSQGIMPSEIMKTSKKAILSTKSADDVSTVDTINNNMINLDLFTSTDKLIFEKGSSLNTVMSINPELNSDADNNTIDPDKKVTYQLEDELVRTERQISSSSENRQDFSEIFVTGNGDVISNDKVSPDNVRNDLISTEMQVLSSNPEIISFPSLTTDKEKTIAKDVLESRSQINTESNDNSISNDNNIDLEGSEIFTDSATDLTTIGDINNVNTDLDISTETNAITVEKSSDFSTGTEINTELDSNEDGDIFDPKEETTVQLDEELIRTERQVISSSQAIVPSAADTTKNEEVGTENVLQTDNEPNTLETDFSMTTHNNVLSETPGISADNITREFPKLGVDGNINVDTDISTDLNFKTSATNNFGSNTETNPELNEGEGMSVDFDKADMETVPPTDSSLFVVPTTVVTPETKTENTLPHATNGGSLTMLLSTSIPKTSSEVTENNNLKSTASDITESLPLTTIKTEITPAVIKISSETYSSSTSIDQLPETTTDVNFPSSGNTAVLTTEKITTTSLFSTITPPSLNDDSSTFVFTTAMSETSPIPFHFTMDANYDEIVGSRKEEFEEHLSRQLVIEMRIPFECLQNLEVRKGSIEVNFDLVPNPELGHIGDEKALKAAADELKRMIDNGQLKISDLEGNSLVVVPIDPPTKSPEVQAQTTLILGVVIGAFILTVISVAAAVIIMKRKNNGIQRLTPIEEARSKLPSYREIPFQEALFMKGPAKNKLMLGKYCYNTGKWLGPGPEPMTYIPPESAVYRPPTDSEVRQTPRPPTAVRERLRNDWELDWDSMVFSR